jgi:glycerophosphoryl diester phosphodiesterase
MKNIISHRGWWTIPSERNTIVAFTRSFESGFGTETDLRDLDGEIVISHDPPRKGALPAKEFFELYESVGNNLPLALNIKSDGLQIMLRELLSEFNVTNYFVFDMSVPDSLGWQRSGFNTFTRQSELELNPVSLEAATGVWLDEFYGHWITPELIESLIRRGKRVCVVSPDLHKRNITTEWLDYGFALRQHNQKCLLCTDTPDLAEDLVYGKN